MKGRKIKYQHATKGIIQAAVMDKVISDIYGAIVTCYLVKESETGYITLIRPEQIIETIRAIPRRRYQPSQNTLDNFANDE